MKKEQPDKGCLDCGDPIERGPAKRCAECGDIHREKYNREYQRNHPEKNKIYKAKSLAKKAREQVNADS